jgi:SAM-dependent methyltransferase
MAVLDLPKAPAVAQSAAYDAFADIYDAFTWDHDYERWVSILEPVVKSHGLSGQRLLDVACGTGKSVLPWLERGYQVEACDFAPRMLEQAKRKVGVRATLRVADMRELPAGEPRDLITCLGDSVNYLLEPGDLGRAFACVARRLRSGGLYLFDLNSLRTYAEDFSATRSFARDGWEFRWTGHGDGQAELGGIARATVTAHRPGRAGAPVASQHVQRHHPIPVVRANLEPAGLEALRVYGQHRDGSLDAEFDELAHSKALVLARRPAQRGIERR